MMELEEKSSPNSQTYDPDTDKSCKALLFAKRWRSYDMFEKSCRFFGFSVFLN